MEAMEHPYFFPIVKDQGRLNAMGSGSPTAALAGGSGTGGAAGAAAAAAGQPAGAGGSPILSPGTTPIPAGQTAAGQPQ